MSFRKLAGWVNVDHLIVTLLVLFLGWLLAFASINLTVFNPVKKAFADFSMTDIFYEIQNSSGVKEFNNDIVLVDMTELYDRRKIAQSIRDIASCQPKVFVIDLIFERPSYDEEENECLINAVSEIKMASCRANSSIMTARMMHSEVRDARSLRVWKALGLVGDSATLSQERAMDVYANTLRTSILWAPPSTRCLIWRYAVIRVCNPLSRRPSSVTLNIRIPISSRSRTAT